ncbi:hypothetical protein, partial [Corallococcus carmarthensis]
MRVSTTTRELTSLLARPALRAMESVAKQLGVRLPEPPQASDEPAGESFREAAGAPPSDMPPP